MPLRTGNTYVIPKRGVVNTKRKTFSGKGPAPGGTRKVKAPTAATVPTVTTSSTGHVSTQNFSSPRAASQAKRQARSSQRRVRRVEAQQASALGFHRRTQQRASEATPRIAESHAKLASLGARSASGMARAADNPPRPPSYKPPKFQGAKTAGTPTLGSLQKAQSKGLLRTNRKGYVTTPAVRRVSKEVKKAQRAVRHSQPSVRGLSPAERAVVPLVRKASRKYPDVPKSVLMAQIRQESGFDPAAKSSADAQGLSQFIPSTAASYGVKYGTGRREQQSQVTGQAHYLHDLGFAKDPQGALSSYSGGYAASDYNNPVLEGAADYKALDKPGNPRALKRLAVTKRKALNLGLAVGKPANVKHADYLKLFGKQITRELHLVKKGDYEKGPGKLVVGSSDVHYGHEPEIAARLKLLSAKLGKPIYIISGHRTPAHSVEVGGFSNDPHTEGKAADIGVGSALRDSAGTITEAQYESVGLHRPYYPESSAEINHVELLNGGTPATGGGGSSGAVTTSGPTALPSSAISSYAAATGQSPKVVRERLKRGKLGPQQILKKLKELGAGLGEGSEKPSEGSESKASVLKALESKYGKATV